MLRCARFSLPVLASIVALASLSTAPRSASADLIGPDCATCQGSTYLLEFDSTPVTTTATTQTFRITLTIDSSYYTGGGAGIDTVAVKISNTLVSAVLDSAPGGVGDWEDFANTGLDADGCSNGGSGFVCAQVGAAGTVPPVGGTLKWEWLLEVNDGALFTNPFQASVKARYVDLDGDKVGALVSEGITLQPMPEPTTGILLGLGLAGLGAARRRS